MPTANVSITPDQGWVLIATAPSFVRVSAYPHTHPYYLCAASSTPAATVVGALMCHKPFWNNVTMTENLYARVTSPVASQTLGKLRLDVITV